MLFYSFMSFLAFIWEWYAESNVIGLNGDFKGKWDSCNCNKPELVMKSTNIEDQEMIGWKASNVQTILDDGSSSYRVSISERVNDRARNQDTNRVSKELYAPALGGIMLSIGIKLSIEDFALAFKRPLPLTVGFLAQYVLKPALGVFVARSFGMSPMYYAGFVLMSCVAGAQLSSYASFLSNGDVALSILLTSTSTIASVLVTPLLTGLLIGSVVPVDAIAMSKSILQVVLLPVTLGLALNTYAKPVASFLQPAMPFVAMFCTSICIGSPLAINRTQILSVEGLKLVWPVLTFHTVAFTFGYWISKLPFCRQDEEVSRTISLCTGMQSSTLAGLLATQFLGSSQAVPPACSVVAMAIMGLCLASFWGNGYRIRDLPYYFIPQTNSTISP
ncbi:probable sodium/metabolite cotransporter BASS3, chloroplastic [Tanacetum coccineum]